MPGHHDPQLDCVPVAVDPLMGPDDPIRTRRRLLDQQVRAADCGDCYADGRGRPSYPAPLLVKALLWGVAQDLSDRELEQACRYDLRAQFLLGLRVDEPGPDVTPCSVFRKRLLGHDQARAAFDAVL